MAQHATVIRVTHFQAVPGKHDELITRLKSGVETMRTVDGCFGVQLCTVRETPNTIAVVSRWQNQAALDQIEKSGTLDVNAIKDLIAGPPATEHLLPVAGGGGEGDKDDD
ncbi:MAG: antibiotic biosynthesis monooxygenase [Chloroflexi bacterium]|nr:antibiotic biosynthesis monooxygenase [Chloroflexota bacterium]